MHDVVTTKHTWTTIFMWCDWVSYIKIILLKVYDNESKHETMKNVILTKTGNPSEQKVK